MCLFATAANLLELLLLELLLLVASPCVSFAAAAPVEEADLLTDLALLSRGRRAKADKSIPPCEFASRPAPPAGRRYELRPPPESRGESPR